MTAAPQQSTPPSTAMTRAQIEAFFSILSAGNPHPKGELHYVNIYTLLVAVALSAQATDVGVNKATGPLFKVADTPQRMLALGEHGLIGYIKSVGLYKIKAKHVIAAARLLVERHGGQVPKDRAALEALPGVGRKTANVVLNIAFGVPTIAVDTHLFRVSNRTGLAHGKTPLSVERALESRVPRSYLAQAHTLLILHGRYVCKARKPQCHTCPVRVPCRFSKKTNPF